MTSYGHVWVLHFTYPIKWKSDLDPWLSRTWRQMTDFQKEEEGRTLMPYPYQLSAHDST